MPALRPEIKAEIVGIDVHIADLILKSQGNYRELQELAETLDNRLDSCELNLNSIRIIPDNSPQPSGASMKDLSLDEKRIIYSCSFTNSLLLNILADLLGETPEDLARNIASKALTHSRPVANDEVEEFISNLLSKIQEAKDNHFLLERVGDPSEKKS